MSPWSIANIPILNPSMAAGRSCFNTSARKSSGKLFQLNQFLIVHVDADITQEAGFDVPHQDENGPLATGELVSRVIQRLRGEIGEVDWEAYAGRFIFAIAVDEIECWILPLWFEGAHAAKKTGCIEKIGSCQNLREELKQKGLRWIRPEEKDWGSYDWASRDYRKPKILHDRGRWNPSLATFLDDLDGRGLTLPPED